MTRRIGRLDALALAGLLVLGVGLPVAVGALAGTLDVPRNDDWAYRRIALDFAQTGVLTLNVRTMIIGQIVLALPFLWLTGLSAAGFACAGIVFAVAAVLGAFALARQFLPPGRAVMPVLLLLVVPGYLSFATSFMTDVPALALQCACLALGAAALRRRPVGGRLLVAALLAGSAAVSLRDFALAAPAAVVLAAVCAEPRRLRHWLAGVAVVAWYGLLTVVRIKLYTTTGIVELVSGGLFQTTQALAFVSLALLPAALAGAVRWWGYLARPALLAGAEVGVVLAVLRGYQWVREGTMPLAILPNLMAQWGAPQREMFLGDRPLLIPDGPWAAVNALALVATMVVLAVAGGVAGSYLRRLDRGRPGWPGRLVARLGSPVGMLALFCLMVAVGTTVYSLTVPVFDRYYWVLIVPVAILLLRLPPTLEPTATSAQPRRSRRASRAGAVLVGAPMVLLAGLALLYQLNANAFDGALWRAGQALVGAGVPADRIDAGYNWVGLYASAPATGGGTSPVRYRQIWPGFHQCGWVTSQPNAGPDAHLIGTQDYNLLLLAGPPERLYLFRSTDPDCQAGVVTQ